MNLAEKTCVPCEGGTRPLSIKEAKKLLAEVPGWRLTDNGKKIIRHFEFQDFIAAMAFVNRVADIAESEEHHPDIHIFYNKVTLELWTHAIGGLSENDYILAAKINITS